MGVKFKTFNDIKQYISSNNIDNDCDAIDNLIDHANLQVVQDFALLYINSEDYLVRSSVYELLGATQRTEYINLLLKSLEEDSNSISKAYAINSICELIDKNVNNDNLYSIITKKYLKSRSPRLRIAYLSVLYKLEGDVEYIDKMLQYTLNDDYHIRYVVLHCLMDIADCNNKQYILDKLDKWFDFEENEALKTDIRESCNSVEMF